MLTLSPYLFVAFTLVTIGASLQSLTGFGMAVIAAPILVLIDHGYLPGPILALGFTLSLLNTLRHTQHLHIANTTRALAGRLIGSAIGISLLSLLPKQILLISFATLTLFSIALTYQRFKVTISSKNLVIAGFLSGVMGTTTSIGGPPMALIYQNSNPVKARAELGLFFLIGTLISLLLLAASGNFTANQLQLTLPLLPAVILGFIISIRLERNFNSKHLKIFSASLSLTACTLIFFQAIK